jgi:hypothetical protein
MRRKIDIRSASLDKRKAASEGIKVLDVEKVMEFLRCLDFPWPCGSKEGKSAGNLR